MFLALPYAVTFLLVVAAARAGALHRPLLFSRWFSGGGGGGGGGGGCGGGGCSDGSRSSGGSGGGGGRGRWSLRGQQEQPRVIGATRAPRARAHWARCGGCCVCMTARRTVVCARYTTESCMHAAEIIILRNYNV
jgi:hypothetical protein